MYHHVLLHKMQDKPLSSFLLSRISLHTSILCTSLPPSTDSAVAFVSFCSDVGSACDADVAFSSVALRTRSANRFPLIDLNLIL